jgi:transposase, IS5 family
LYFYTNQMQGIMAKPVKKRASSPKYLSPGQIVIAGFETPFTQKLDPTNRWIILANSIPWDTIAGVYNKTMTGSKEGRPPLSARIVLGAIMIKHINDWSDEDTILHVQENMYLQYFLGFSSFTTAPIFDSSLFVEIRKRMGESEINQINELIVKKHLEQSQIALLEEVEATPKQDNDDNDNKNEPPPPLALPTHHGKMITDATACPQDIAYPTDLNLLNDAREKSEWLIDILYEKQKGIAKPRTYRKLARKDYLKVAKNKNKTKKLIRRSVGEQLNYLKRNLGHLKKLIEVNKNNVQKIKLGKKELTYLEVITTLYAQQKQMHSSRTHSIEDRIVSIHQPHVRPIVRGKANAKTEFGSKIEITLANGFAFLDQISWDAFNEGTQLMAYVNKYKERLGYFPKEILVDSIFCTRANRKELKGIGVKLVGKPLGRPSKTAVKEYIRPGERNPIEGKIGQGKTAYGLGRIKARLKDTSESWIASIILVLNLVKLAGLKNYAKTLAIFCHICSKLEIRKIQYRPLGTLGGVFLDFE